MSKQLDKINVYFELAWENDNIILAMSPLVSPRNDIWQTSAEIPC